MDTLPLPPRPNLEQYRKRAKDLHAAAHSNEPDAVRAWAQAWLQALSGLLAIEITPFVRGSFDRAVSALETEVRNRLGTNGTFTLSDAQHLIARAHGFTGWSAFIHHVGQLSRREGPDSLFERAADAVVNGDLATLQELVHAQPGLVHARSGRQHRATLLHYVAANGVEDFRQKSPENAVAVAEFLLQQGAEVDALAETYGGGTGQTTMNLLVTSVHPEQAGVQTGLVDVLLDAGAALNGLEDDGTPLLLALSFGYPDAAEALARRGARVDNIAAAAALGQLDLLREFVAQPNAPVQRLAAIDWLHLPADLGTHMQRGFALACAYGRTAVAEFLLDQGVDSAAHDNYGTTGLHWAASNARLQTVRLLLQRGAPLESLSASHETVLQAAVRHALRFPHYIEYYLAVLEELLEAGADARVVAYPTGHARVDEMLEQHGARSR